MVYKIFRVDSLGILRDVGYTDYSSYLKAEKVVFALKKKFSGAIKPKRYVILKMY